MLVYLFALAELRKNIGIAQTLLARDLFMKTFSKLYTNVPQVVAVAKINN